MSRRVWDTELLIVDHWFVTVDGWMYERQLLAVTIDYRQVKQAGIAGHPLFVLCVS